jgi:PAS domain S-box-containing protein
MDGAMLQEDDALFGSLRPGSPAATAEQMPNDRAAPDDQSAVAVITLDAAGHYVDANPAALELLGISLSELRASAPDRFAMQPANGKEQAKLREEWESGGSRPLVGTAGLRRADGTSIRVSYAIEATAPGFRARLRQIDGTPQAPPSVFTVSDVLREWRAAERELAELAPGTPEWTRTQEEIELLRGQYQELFRAIQPQPGSP